LKRFSPESIIALKEALTHIYWRRKDIRQFVYHTINNKMLVATIDWENSTKEESVSILLSRLLGKQDIYKDDILSLFDAVLHFKDFSHLKIWDDSDTKIRNAKSAVEALRKQTSGYFKLKEEKERALARRKAFESMQKEREASRAKLSNIKATFYKVAALNDPHQRGYAFESFLNDLFEYYDLDPRRSFRIYGEQIDGAFTFENTDYIVEAKWQQTLVNLCELYKFSGKVSSKLKLTMGLFVSFQGFTSECLQAGASRLSSMILMDGKDIMIVLDGRIDLPELMYRKRRHASETGSIFLPAIEIL